MSNQVPPHYGAYVPQQPQGPQQYYPEQDPNQHPQPVSSAGSPYQNQDQQYQAAGAMNPPQQPYVQALPMTLLNRSPAPVDCPLCGQRSMTKIDFETGNTTHLWAALACMACCLGCIPYLINGTKDIKHNCGNCGVLLATWHRSGGNVEIHAHSMVTPGAQQNIPMQSQGYKG